MKPLYGENCHVFLINYEGPQYNWPKSGSVDFLLNYIFSFVKYVTWLSSEIHYIQWKHHMGQHVYYKYAVKISKLIWV